MAKRKTIADTSAEIIGELKKRIYKPVYILAGDEYYYVDLLTDFIAENVLSESERAFNQIVVYGKDVDVSTIIETSRRFPMMANQQVVIVKEAQQIKKIEDLEIYLKAPQKSTILVICFKFSPGGKPNAAVKKLFTLAGKVGVYFDSKRLYDNQVPVWITEHLGQKGYSISPASAELLKDYLGNDLSKVAKELEKLVITLPTGQTKITTDHIEKNIGISKDFNRFELTNALGARDVLKANRIVDHFAKNPGANPMVLSTLAIYNYFKGVFKCHFVADKSERSLAPVLGVNPFFVSDYLKASKRYSPRKCVQVFELLRDYDLRSKGVNNDSVDHGELLKELVFKILH